MHWQPELSNYGIVLLFIAGGILFLFGGLALSRMFAPRKPNPEKNSSYECGEDTVGNARVQLNVRFYVVALIFLIFEVEIIMLYPWATVFADVELIRAYPAWGWLAFAEAAFFVIVLAVGLAYVWAKKDLDWVKPDPIIPDKIGTVPAEVYAAFNGRV